MTDRDSVCFGEATIEYEVRRSQRRRKTIQITVERGRVRVAAPMSTPDGELRAIVHKRAPWIIRHLQKEALAAAPKRFVSGETLPYLGRNVRMIVQPAAIRTVEMRFDHWRFRVAAPPNLSGDERVQQIRRAFVSLVPRPRRGAPACGCRALAAPARPGKQTPHPHPRPETALGKLRPGWHIAF